MRGIRALKHREAGRVHGLKAGNFPQIDVQVECNSHQNLSEISVGLGKVILKQTSEAEELKQV